MRIRLTTDRLVRSSPESRLSTITINININININSSINSNSKSTTSRMKWTENAALQICFPCHCCHKIADQVGP
eukprot:g45214.t1